ncbi:MAG: hypothetical protein QG604_265 [Candidatus Dependentiae bacterium]|nr:hypothetical protein [Candidatus Dependentiae bacterium]
MWITPPFGRKTPAFLGIFRISAYVDNLWIGVDNLWISFCNPLNNGSGGSNPAQVLALLLRHAPFECHPHPIHKLSTSYPQSYPHSYSDSAIVTSETSGEHHIAARLFICHPKTR